MAHVESEIDNVSVAQTSNEFRSWGDNGFILVIMALRYSTRRCYDPADYVYGMLGMMQIKIPRMEDPNQAWRHLLSELDDLARPYGGGKWIDHADELDLRQVENIGQVYMKLYTILCGI